MKLNSDGVRHWGICKHIYIYFFRVFLLIFPQEIFFIFPMKDINKQFSFLFHGKECTFLSHCSDQMRNLDCKLLSCQCEAKTVTSVWTAEQTSSFIIQVTDNQAEVLGIFTASYLCFSPVGGSSKLGKHVGCF